MPRVKKQEMLMEAYFLEKTFVIDDPEFPFDEHAATWLQAFKVDKYGALFHFGFMEKQIWFSPALDFLHHIAENVIKRLSQVPELEFVRDGLELEPEWEDLVRLKEELPFVVGMEFVDEGWIHHQWEEILDAFRKEIKTYEGTVSQYMTDQNPNIHVVGRIFFHLVENKDEEYPFAFMATYSNKPVQSKRAVHTPLKNALTECKGDDKKLLSLISTVIKAAEYSAFITQLLESGELFSPIKLTADEAYTVLKEIPVYEEAGILCRVPDWWRKKSNALKLNISVGEKPPSSVGLDALVDFSPHLCVGDDVITQSELQSFLQMAEGLIRYKGKWVEVDQKKLEAILHAFETVQELSHEEPLSVGEALRLELNKNRLFGEMAEEMEVSVSNGQWLRDVKNRLIDPVIDQEISQPPTFHARLRDYQKAGYRWLDWMAQLGFGACLADDMGLGKTVQMIGFLEHRRTLGAKGALLIIPASLIGNWERELKRFAPEMPYQVLHKSSLSSVQTLHIQEENFLFITTYGMAVKMEELRQRTWDYLILDEAQAIKNPGTKQTKAIKSIPASMRIAMTGTPIENRLSDLWSLFDFLNQGLLGTAKEFTDFTKGLHDSPLGYARLRKITQPFILRRVKTDKNIIADLPDKVEINEYTSLSKKQIALYEQLIQEIGEKLRTAEGIERKGLVLASILKFKQICNHPDQYLGREEYKPELSGKFQQLEEICETIREKKERILVFTQFREMTEPLSAFLSTLFGKEGFVLHGGTPVKKRSDMVEQFNGEAYIPYMVLSLKAGGVGLNLTSANHVIHFDRWWNPAVENQATDRAFRIGQTKNVMVHKFITKGSIEEKIDAMIQDKVRLAGDILHDGGEQWITEYSNEDLMKIFALERDL